jgi:hypothetical protein
VAINNALLLQIKGGFMDRCFVIQPFDNGKFDERFKDTFQPAIAEANLEAYRVDRDSNVRIPIADIEAGIRNSVICFADITTDNPNVWYELGFAFACKKDVVMVSANPQKQFPFDIQHRKIIKYTTDSKSDFEKLGKDITETLISYRKNSTTIQKLHEIPLQETEGLAGHEIAVLVLLTERSDSNDDFVPTNLLRREMSESGYKDIATSVALRTLKNKKMIDVYTEYPEFSNGPLWACKLTSKGEQWILSNQHLLNFRIEDKKSEIIIDTNEEDIPF